MSDTFFFFFLNRQFFSFKPLLTLHLKEKFASAEGQVRVLPARWQFRRTRGGSSNCLPTGRSVVSPSWSCGPPGGPLAPRRVPADGEVGLCCRRLLSLLCYFTLQQLSGACSQAGDYVRINLSIFLHNRWGSRLAFLILANLLHFQLSSSEKDEVDGEWVLPSNSELLASTWFPWAVTKSVLKGWLTEAETEFIQESALVSNPGRNKIDLSF